jgi:hypothetical protein
MQHSCNILNAAGMETRMYDLQQPRDQSQGGNVSVLSAASPCSAVLCVSIVSHVGLHRDPCPLSEL